jgi:hypothetical protein
MTENKMNSNPFNSNSSIIEKGISRNSIPSSLLGFYICSFEVSHGLQVLYSYPKILRKNNEELNILKTHCIWRIEHIPLCIDLKFSEFVFSAFQLHKKENEEVIATQDQPLFGVVLKLWKDGEHVSSNILKEFKRELEEFHWHHIEFLYKRALIKSNPTQRRNYKKLLKESELVEQSIKQLWETFNNKISNYQIRNSKIQEDIDDTTLFHRRNEITRQDLFKDRITLKIIETGENPEGFLVLLVNQIDHLSDVSIEVSKRTDFFSEILWEQVLEEWPIKEELILEFPRSPKTENFLIKIRSNNQTISIKSLKTH